MLTPCAEGWRETEIAGVTACEPWPEEATRDCPPGQAQLLGNVECVPLLGACPAGDFAVDLPAGAPVIYVLASAAPGGDGSVGAPHASLAEALAAPVPEGTVIALGAGTYEGASMPPGLTLVGACPERTVVRAPSGAEAALVVEMGTLEVRGLRVEPRDEPGDEEGLIARGATTTLILRGVDVASAGCSGIEVLGEASLDAEPLVVRDTRPCSDPSKPEAGIRVMGSRAEVRRALVARNGRGAILMYVSPSADTDAALVLEDTIVRDNRSASLDLPRGAGLWAEVLPETAASATVEVRRCLFEGDSDRSLAIRGERMVGDVSEVLTRRNGSIGRPVGHDVVVDRDASLRLSRRAITEMTSSAWAGAVSFHTSSQPSALEDVVIAENKNSGLRVLLHEGGVHGRRLVTAGNQGREVFVLSGTLTLTDARLRPDRIAQFIDPSTGEAAPGYAILVSSELGLPTHLALERSVLEESVSTGIAVADLEGVGATLSLTDAAIRHTQALAGAGRGVEAVLGAELTGHRVLIEQTDLAGVDVLNGGARVKIEDGIIRNIEPYPGEDVGGRGLALAVGSTALLRRARIEGTHEMAIAAFGSTVILEDVELRRTDIAACAGRGACLSHGHALGVYYGSTLTADRFLVDDAASCGIHFALGSEVDLHDGLVTHTEIGACVQVDGYDVARLQNNVFYRDNARNLDVTHLPVPDPGS